MLQTCGLQLDSVSPLPFVPELEALYVNGRFAHTPYSVGPGRVWIDVLGNAPHQARWADVEKQDMTAEQFPGWQEQRHAAGMGWGGGYCSEVSLAAMIDGTAGRSWDLWFATLDGSVPSAADLGLPARVKLVAVQAFPAASVGFNADVSVVVDAGYWQLRRAA